MTPEADAEILRIYEACHDGNLRYGIAGFTQKLRRPLQAHIHDELLYGHPRDVVDFPVQNSPADSHVRDESINVITAIVHILLYVGHGPLEQFLIHGRNRNLGRLRNIFLAVYLLELTLFGDKIVSLPQKEVYVHRLVHENACPAVHSPHLIVILIAGTGKHYYRNVACPKVRAYPCAHLKAVRLRHHQVGHHKLGVDFYSLCHAVSAIGRRIDIIFL